MMAHELVRQVQGHGAAIWANGDKLELELPDNFPDVLMDALRQHKTAVLDYLSHQNLGSVPEGKSFLLAWAADLAQREVVLADPVSFIEEPLRPVWITKVSKYARQHLRFIVYARMQQRTGGMGDWLPPWWKEREDAALGALEALHQALQEADTQTGEGQGP
jgi:hypothetical protein